MPPPILFQIEDATFVRPAGEVVFANLSWTLREGETWAIVGGVGAGKSSLTDVIVGRLPATSGRVCWPIVERARAAGQVVNWPAEIIARVAFREESRCFSYAKHYYQQRFNFIEPDDDLTLDEYLRSGNTAPENDLAGMADRLGIEQLRPLSFIKLSNGQVRRARIAKALLHRPELLILDEPFAGLDAAGRADLRTLLTQLVGSGTRLVLIGAPDALPDCVTHVLELTAGRVTFAGPRRQFRPAAVDAGVARAAAPSTGSTPIIELRHVSVVYAEKPILSDVSWTVRTGERWAILGPNGSGKSTLLSLICGDNPQAFANDITVFGQRRGAGQSIWELKRQIGFFSPELHLYFSEPLSADRVAATGFFDVLAPRPTTVGQDATIDKLFAYFRASALRARPFAQLSIGQQRLTFLIRALVKDAPLLILDEPFQVLDDETRSLARTWIDGLPPERTVLFVTHDAGELPQTVTRRLLLNAGTIAQIA